MSGRSNILPFKFYAITDRSRIRRSPWTDHVRALLDEGVQAVQIREKDLSTRQLIVAVDAILERPDSASFLWINDRADIILARDLAGVHLAESSMRPSTVRSLIGSKMIGVSVHSLEGAAEASAEGADFIVAGPIAPTQSKPPGHSLMSEASFKEICLSVNIPVLAIGGITLDAVPRLLELGAYGVAGISIALDDTAWKSRLKSLRDILGEL
jgi:thiamine-phosphate pyrophosphorylase